METLSDEWIIRLSRPPATRYIFGYNFDLNPACAHLLTNDKSAASEVLEAAGLPHVEHRLFLHPDWCETASAASIWAAMAAFARQHDYQLVCKPNDASAGRDVLRVASEPDLQRAVQRLFERHRAICLSPYKHVGREYRLIMLEDECVLGYAKRRPVVTGDGRSTLLELIAEAAKVGVLPGPAVAAVLEENGEHLFDVLADGQMRDLSWRHNLNLLSRPEALEDGDTAAELRRLAGACMRAFNLRFASVDVIETHGRHLVLEVNSGVMMEAFARISPDGFQRAKQVYAGAVDRMFADASARRRELSF